MGLMDDPFTYQLVQGGTVRVSRGGRVVVIVGGTRAARLRTDLQQASSPEDEQLLLARITGNYRRGNERHSK